MAYKGPIIFVWLMFLCSEAAAVVGIICLFDENDKWRNHSLFMVISMVYINGHGMILFRLFPGFRTRKLKYIHALFHTIAAGLAAFAYMQVCGKKKLFSKLHLTLSLTTIIAFGLEWITAVIVFIYMYSDQARRRTFSGWHNFFGITILQLSIATAITMIQEVHYEEKTNITAGMAIISLVVYGVFINLIVLNPYVEWRLVGPI